MKEIYHQFFNQPKNSMECGPRCLWMILFFKSKLNISYNQFLASIFWLDINKHGLYYVDMFRMLSHFGIEYRVTFPDRKGLYLVSYSVADGLGHYCLYKDGYFYDPADSEPRKMRLGTLRSKVSSGSNPPHGYTISFAEIK